MSSTYFWTQLEDTDFSLGVVVPVARQKEELDALQPPRGKTNCTVIVISKIKEVKYVGYALIVSKFHKRATPPNQKPDLVARFPVRTERFGNCTQSINQSMDRSIDRSIDQSINQSVSQSVSQSID